MATMATNENHEELLQKLQESVQDLLPQLPENCDFGRSPFDYHRYLQGFNYKLEPAVARLRRTLRNRSVSPMFQPNYQTSLFIDETWFYLAPTKPPCFSKQGYFLLYEPVGVVDVKSFLRTSEAGWFQFLMDHLRTVEVQYRKEILEMELKTGKQSGLYLVWDLKGFPAMTDFFMNLATPLKELTEYFTIECTEVIQKMTILHAPTIFQKVWAIFRPFIPERTRAKLQIPRGDGIEELLEDFEPENLPELLGGTRKVDLTDKTQAFLPPRIRGTVEAMALDLADFQKFKLNAGNTLLGTIPFQGLGSKGQLEVKILTNSAVIFGLYHHETAEQPLEPESDKLIYPEMCPLPTAQFYPEILKLEVSEQGFYKVRLQNSSQWYFSSVYVQIQAAIVIEENDRLEASFEII